MKRLSQELIAEIERVAAPAFLPGEVEGDWCGMVADRVSPILLSRGIAHVLGSDREYAGGSTDCTFGHHTWIELSDGTIVDPTITQFGTQEEVGWPGTSRTAIVPSGHPFAAKYGRRPVREKSSFETKYGRRRRGS